MKVALYCAVVFLLASAPVLCADAHSMSPAEKRIFEELNHERVKNSLKPLEWNESAAGAARAHTRLLAENGNLAHQFRGEAGLPERIGATGARFTVAAENVARTEWIEDVHPALMGSPGHRANMLSPRYNAVGIGVIEDKGRIYVTQDFIFLVPEYSEALFASAFAESFNIAHKGRRAEARSDSLLHELACATDGDAAKLAGQVSRARSVVVFTSSDPHSLPEQILGRAADFHHMNFGVCFRPDQEHGYANFWVVATFSN
ncbi:MAG TPA: CAP domain-containing protein [Candidatus Angelobacter sp.]|nr:CAP domain-containing protein [Candidatus Angelobacter sp.]